MSKLYQLRADGYITRNSDGASIPPSNKNQDYRDYQAWLALGNTPDPVPPSLIDAAEDFGPSILQLFGG